jgi:hypothetical protein
MPPKLSSSSQGTKSSQGTPLSTTHPTATPTYTAIVDHIADLCGFAKDSTMMQIIGQQRWSALTMDKVGDLLLYKRNGIYWAKTFTHHVCKLQCFLLIHNQIVVKHQVVLIKWMYSVCSRWNKMITVMYQNIILTLLPGGLYCW